MLSEFEAQMKKEQEEMFTILRHEKEALEDELILLANEVRTLEKDFSNKKQTLGLIKAEMLLKTNWVEAIGKEKPTVAEKESFIELETRFLKEQLDELEAEKNFAKKKFQIKFKLAEI